MKKPALKRATEAGLASDKMLGLAGSGLAVASLGFGLYMNMHGPAPGSFGTGHDFSVFAQLAPRPPRPDPGQVPGQVAAKPASTDDALDMTATATIPKAAARALSGETAEPDIIASVTLEAASPDAATIVVDGQTQTVRVGDEVPGAGEVLEIRTGERPSVKTSRGLIVSARE